MDFIEITSIENTSDLKQLYIDSFIPEERINFDELFNKGLFKDFKLICLYNFGQLVGMMHYIVKNNFVHLNYLAINNKLRGRGYGSKCLSWLKNMYKKPIVVDIEEEEKLDNNSYISLRKKILQQKRTCSWEIYVSLEWCFYDIYAYRKNRS